MQYMDASLLLNASKNADGLNYLRRLQMAGKGDKYRPVDRKKYEENYDKIFKAIERINNKFDKALTKLSKNEDKNTKRP